MSPRVQSARQKAHKAERALGELSLSVTTFADKKRIDLVQTGMRALDDEQANVKDTVAQLIGSLATGYTEVEVLEDLRDLVKKWSREK